VQIRYLITICSNAEEKCAFLPGVGKRYYWPIEDPAAVEGSEEERMAAFRETRDAIESRVLDWLAGLDTDGD
jgi:arsenate reductase